MADPARNDWIGTREDRWTDVLPQSWQSAINTNPVVNALARYMQPRQSFDQYAREWQDNIPGNSPIDRIAEGRSTIAKEYPSPMNPLAADMLEKGGFLANFLAPGGVRLPGRPQMMRAPETGGGGGPTQPGIKAYHGSPHDFDKFDISKIGTGEGAQAYGRGLYFAESEGVAKSYRQNLSRADGGIDQIAQTLVDQAGGDWKKALQKFESEALSRVRSLRDAGLNYELPPHDVATLQALRKGEPGRMYEVRINADPEQFLDWDKPLSQQPEAVRSALEKIGVKAPDKNAMKSFDDALLSALEGDGSPNLPKQPSDPMGEQIVRRLHSQRGSSWLDPSKDGEAAASQALRDAGIPGIKYKDAMSRDGGGPGTSNYVVFDAALIEILRKYGLLPPVAAGAATALTQGQDTAF